MPKRRNVGSRKSHHLKRKDCSNLFDGHAFCEISGLVDVGTFKDGCVVRQQLYRDGVEDGGNEGIDLREGNGMDGIAAQGVSARRIRKKDHAAAPGDDFLHVGGGFFQQWICRRDDDNRHAVIDERDGPVLHFTGGIALRMYVADLF